jgi:hypothetical protein
MHPLDGLPSPYGIRRQELSGFLGEILQDSAGLEQRQRLAAGPAGIKDRRDLSIGIERKEFRRLLIVQVKSTRCTS